MPLGDVGFLRQSAIVERIASVSFDGIANSYILKVRVELKNGWLMDYWEHRAPGLRRYSFHVFQDNLIIVRWDNAPHHPEVKTFPHHKHLAGEIQDSEEIDVETVLAELEKMI